MLTIGMGPWEPGPAPHRVRPTRKLVWKPRSGDHFIAGATKGKRTGRKEKR